MKRSFSMLVLVGFALTAIQAGSAEAKGTKAAVSTPTLVSSGRPGSDGHGGKIQKLPPSVDKLPNGLNTTVLGQTPVQKLPPSVDKFPVGYNPTKLGHTPITFGGNPPRAPQPVCHHHCHHHCGWFCGWDTEYVFDLTFWGLDLACDFSSCR